METNEIKDQNLCPDSNPGGDVKGLLKETIYAYKRLEESLDRMWESDHVACVTSYAFLDMSLSSKMQARMEIVKEESEKK